MSQLVKSTLKSVATSRESPPIVDKIHIQAEDQQLFLPESRQTKSLVTYLSTEVGEEVCLRPDNLYQGIVGVHFVGSPVPFGRKDYLLALQYYLNMDVVNNIEPRTRSGDRWVVLTSDIEELTLSHKGIDPLQIHTITEQADGKHTVLVSLRDSLYLYCPTCGKSLESDIWEVSPSKGSTLSCPHCQYETELMDHVAEESGVRLDTFPNYFQSF